MEPNTQPQGEQQSGPNPEPQTVTPQPQQVITPTNSQAQPTTPIQPSVAQPLSAPQNQPQQPEAKNPGNVLAIVSLVSAFLGLSLIGLILAIIAKVKSKKAGLKNTVATVSIIINSLFVVASICLVLLVVALAMPTIKARSAAQAFTNDIVAGNYSGALSYTSDPNKEVDTTTAYLTHIHDEIGDSQNTISSASQNGYYGFVFKTNGKSAYYRVVIKDGKVYDASIDTVELKPLGSSNETTIN